MVKSLVLSLLGLAFVHAAAAAPAAEPQPALPEIITGPGWPTLAELNLTSAQLHAMPPPDEVTRAKARALFARDKGEQGKCGPVDDAYADVSLIIPCFHYIRAMADKMYSVIENNSLNGICAVDKKVAVSVTGQWGVSKIPGSVGRDVALGLLWIIDHCTRDAKDVAGQQAANGNGDLLVQAMRYGYYIDHGGGAFISQ
ncbi:hypothetical protein C8A05DRAFT_34518 [Staphylotrichum tortipilum]|uniref:Transglycosylase SLT domain-containing protein n=1 Tax=Staphylotrichum tortipilum TaxID=2831512 RepID=A0AAN6MJ07_9PEZI|nr:hypothetical protein C8A05DRAFT_34518 [Staphylotrichum longicolle]